MHSLYFNISICAGSNRGIPNDLMQKKKQQNSKSSWISITNSGEAVNAYQQTSETTTNIPGAATAAEWILIIFVKALA